MRLLKVRKVRKKSKAVAEAKEEEVADQKLELQFESHRLFRKNLKTKKNLITLMLNHEAELEEDRMPTKILKRLKKKTVLNILPVTTMTKVC